jgi:dTDP-4-dehydrorhamnose 3,5-epimerase
MYRSEKLSNMQVKRLVVHSDDRGFLFEVLRNDDGQFRKFGQAYINYTEAGVIKGFHKHFENEDNFVCISGRIRLVIIDEETEEFREFYLGPENLILVNIPAGLQHGWQALGNERACVINVSTMPYNPDNPDEERVSPDHFPFYTWKVVNR